jgi:16S rRNA (guanine527-N7)-methyltransferase
MTPEEFAVRANVSRETLSRLEAIAAMLIKWQQRINLVASDSLADLWRRHILDSAQLLPLLPPETENLADLGSGAGFPGLVLAVMGVPEVHLLEADARKCVYLAEAARVAGLEVGRNPIIHRERIEAVRDLKVRVVAARACAPLSKLLDYAESLLRSDSVCLFLKGVKVAEELTEAEKTWRMAIERFPSISHPSGTILRLSQVARARR